MDKETAQLLELLGVGQDDTDESGVVPTGRRDHTLLQRGELSLQEYLDSAVDRALSQVRGMVEAEQLQAEQLETMRAILMQDLQEDPTLARYLGQMLAPAAGAGGHGTAG